jgi:peptidyl-prolyl cis-trans isomerase B (cyclophilin B)
VNSLDEEPLSLGSTPVSLASIIRNIEKRTMKRLICLMAAMLLTAPAVHAQQETDNLQESGKPQVTLHTNRGDIRLELYPDEAPVSVANFLQYANDGFYNGTIFHRVIGHFMIQGGGMTPDMERKPTREPIINEADNGLKNVRGSVAMARTNDVNSATSQFYINVELNGALDHVSKQNDREWGYAVFGRVVDGMDVVDDIRFVETDARDIPLEVVLIESVEVH